MRSSRSGWKTSFSIGEGITNSQIDGFSKQNVLSSLTVRKTLEGCDLILNYAVSASISAKRLWVKLSPGNPEHTHWQFSGTDK